MDDQTQPQDPQQDDPNAGQPTPPTPPPTGDSGTTPPPPPPPAGDDKKDLSGIMDENVDISSLVANAGNSQSQQDFISSVKIPAHPNTKFDEQVFIQLLAGSISLTLSEKKKIIEAIPQLSQFQLDELMKIFQEEKGKFAELEKKHADQISDLEKQHKGNWQDLEAQKEEESKQDDEAKQAEDIKKQLGLE